MAQKWLQLNMSSGGCKSVVEAEEFLCTVCCDIYHQQCKSASGLATKSASACFGTIIAPDVCISLQAEKACKSFSKRKVLKISGPTHWSIMSSLLAQTEADDYMKPCITAVFVLMDWSEATLNMAELPDSLFVTFHYAHLTHCRLNKTLIMIIQSYIAMSDSLHCEENTEVTPWASLFND